MKNIMRQFIFENLNLSFDFTEEIPRLHNFVKIASWSLPLTLKSRSGINVVHTICALANYYGVGLEVIRTDSGKEDDSANDTILKCAEDGNWVFLSTAKYPKFLTCALKKLRFMR